MAKTEHVHKFRRHTYKSGSSVYFCILPDCNKKVSPALTLGKRAVCWRCGKDFIMNDYSIRLAKPHCQDCHQSKGQVEIPKEITAIDWGKEKDSVAIVEPPKVKKDPIAEMRARLSGNPTHGNLAANLEEEDI